MDISMEHIRPCDRVRITCISEFNPLKERLREFGLVTDTQVFCPFLSPAGDLAALEFGGTVIAVRVKDLAGIRARRC